MARSSDDTSAGPSRSGERRRLEELVGRVAFVDHHCHGIVRGPLDRAGFESLLCEADAPGPWHGSLFDTQVGLAVRRLCSPLLDLAPHAPADDYLARRAELGSDEVARRLLRGAGISEFFVDTGFRPDGLTTPDELAARAGASAREIVRLESVAERVIADHRAGDFVATCRDGLAAAAATAIGFKSIAAYRVGLDLAPDRPATSEVAAAAARWAAGIERGAPIRLADETLIRFLIWTAVDLGLPIQFHTGFGDADADLGRCDPLLLAPLLRATAGLGVPIMLLHTYPFHRHAGALAQVFDHVFVDVGLAMQNVGSRAGQVLAELLELAPFGSVVFSSDGYGLPELFHVSATLFRRALSDFLAAGVADDAWSHLDAERIARLIAADNAHRAYGLDGEGAGRGSLA
ncbi:amidohydrolase family protein [Rhodococcus daqingensis]|uniref:Amidohydrolase family protein n=1 Tax=Rhodococcus daqingensis TaxID=2479363 RepID=A0ABW2S453_9NOCA